MKAIYRAALLILPIIIILYLFLTVAFVTTGWFVSVGFDQIIDPDRPGEDVNIGLGRFLEGEQLLRDINITFDEAFSTGTKETNITARVTYYGSTINYDNGVPAEKTLDLAPILEKKGIVNEEGKYTYKNLFFNFTVNLTANNISTEPFEFNYSYDKEYYEELTKFGNPENFPSGDDNKFYLRDHSNGWYNEDTDGNLYFNTQLGNDETWHLTTYVYVKATKILKWHVYDIDDYIKITVNGNVKKDFSRGPFDTEFTLNRGEINTINLQIRNTNGPTRFRIRVDQEEVTNFSDQFDIMNSKSFSLPGSSGTSEYWQKKMVEVHSRQGGELLNYCSGPADFEGPTGIRSSENCTDESVEIKRESVQDADSGLYDGKGIEFLKLLTGDKSYRFTTWIYTNESRKISLSILVNSGVSIVLDNNFAERIACGCQTAEECSDGNNAYCENEELSIPIGVHKLDVYLYCRDECYLEALPIDFPYEYFLEAFTGAGADQPTNKWWNNGERTVSTGFVSKDDGLKDIGISSHERDAKRYDNIMIENEDLRDKIDLSLRMACGNEYYGECSKICTGCGDVCRTNSNGWIIERMLTQVTTKNWAEKGADREMYIEPFDHHSLDDYRDKYMDNSAIGGIYKCPGTPGVCDWIYDTGIEDICCEYQNFSAGHVERNGKTGWIKIINYDANTKYFINYLVYDGYNGTRSGIMDFTMFKNVPELPKFCAYIDDVNQQDKIEHVTWYNNTGDCGKDTGSGCCFCTPEYQMCTLQCKNDIGIIGNRYTLPFSLQGNGWKIDPNTIKLTLNSSVGDDIVILNATGDHASGWTITAELNDSFIGMLYENRSFKLNLFNDFGLYAPNTTGKYVLEVEIKTTDTDGTPYSRIIDRSVFRVAQCSRIGELDLNYFNDTKYPNKRNVGACSEGVRFCNEDYEWDYNYSHDMPGEPAAEEICNGIDDDCNGWIDDIGGIKSIINTFTSYGGMRTAAQITECGCFGGSPKAKEVCDGIDNDCDGIKDDPEDSIWINNCTESVNECEDRGDSRSFCRTIYDSNDCDFEEIKVLTPVNVSKNTCTDEVRKCMTNRYLMEPGTTFTYDDCKEIYQESKCYIDTVEVVVLGNTCNCILDGAQKETCNGMDDDCDGLIDDVEYPGTCACDRLSNITLIAELTDPANVDDTCDGIDDNCDGSIDEDTVQCACKLRNANEVVNIWNSAELCDGIDNDCNGLKDEGFRNDSCGFGSCEGGYHVCSSDGSDTVCNTTVESWKTFLGNAYNYISFEDCDFVDNDCDGSVDEECACSPSDLNVIKICGYNSGIYYRSQNEIDITCSHVIQNISSLITWTPDISVYRMQMNITNPNSFDLRNYPFVFPLNTFAAITSKKMNPDGSDIMISGAGDETDQFEWYNISKFNHVQTDISFMDTIPANSSKEYYVFYGRPTSAYSPPPKSDVWGVMEETDTLLLCRFENSSVCRPGNMLTSVVGNVSYMGGQYDLGIKLQNNPSSMVRYPISANFNNLRGTIEFWIKPAGAGQRYLFHVKDTDGGDQFIIYLDSGKLKFDIKDSSGTTHSLDGGTISNDQWILVTASWDVALGMELYVNGNSVATSSNGFNLKYVGTDMYIGSRSDRSLLCDACVFDEFIVYSSKLTDETVKTHARKQPYIFNTGPEESIEALQSGSVEGDIYQQCDEFMRMNVGGPGADAEKVATIASLCQSIQICNKTFSIHSLSTCALGVQSCVDSEWSNCSGNVMPSEEICNGMDNNCDGIVDNVQFPDTCACYMGNHSPGELKEICNGVDDDCDGLIDNVNGKNSKEESHCGCFNETVNISMKNHQQENPLCNGIDDNCDGTIDEGVSDCACSFTVYIDNDNENISGKIKAETCNGRDDNCNGAIDEKFKNYTVNGVNQSLGEGCGGSSFSDCFGGHYVCSKSGITTVCSHTSDQGVGGSNNARPELCDGRDNDCDGIIDNIFGENSGQYCQCYNGAERLDEICNGMDDNCNGLIDDDLVGCACTINQILNHTTFNKIKEFLDRMRASSEICNNIDENCDGTVDEGLEASCWCAGGFGGNPLTRPEFCNGVDDDCNGIVDDVTIGGTCACSDGGSSSNEICNGMDDNCNGIVDEDWWELGSACGWGVCSGGLYECNAGGDDTVCSTIEGSDAKKESEKCDNVDNDCDLSIDEGCACTTGDNKTCGINAGICSEGYQLCLGGKWGSCMNLITPEKEICNGMDDNCNGIVDDIKGGGSVASTQCECYGGRSPSNEVCNGIDDDCDGRIDNVGGGTSVSSAKCGCYENNFGQGAGVEHCNGIDDNCNGIKDDVKMGTSVEDTKCACYGDGSPGTEICDGIDNDCNGRIDEGFPEIGGTCGIGVCSGRYECSPDGSSAICSGRQPETEICDGKDNDCDGVVDEGCFAGSISSCENGVKDGSEEGVDCGGLCPDQCLPMAPQLPPNTWLYVFVIIVIMIVVVAVSLFISNKKEADTGTVSERNPDDLSSGELYFLK